MSLEISIRNGRRYIRCPKCVGSGLIVWPEATTIGTFKEIRCPACNGSGEEEVPPTEIHA